MLALATHDPDTPRVPYPAPLYYALVEDTAALGLTSAHFGGAGPGLICLSDPATQHGRHLGQGPTPVAAAVYLETEAVAEIRGVQLRAVAWRHDALERQVPGTRDELAARYLARHPVAQKPLQSDKPPCLYLLVVDWAKVTDNRRAFGHHAQWQRKIRARDD